MSLKVLQEKVGVGADGVFGPGTLCAAAKHLGLSDVRAAHFFGQTAHETGGFKAFSENLNYSSAGLMKTFKKYFPTKALADKYAKNAVGIGSRVYAGRMGNGDEASFDGWRYRGRGALQLTGKSNYEAFAKWLGKDEVLSNPDLVATEYAFDSALFFFDRNKLWDICDKGVNDDTILALTKRVNGGTHGLEDRASRTKQYYKWLLERD
jgi:putative chitinase